MADRAPIFPAQEFRDRIRRLQSELLADALDALLLTSAADVFYTTGFLTRFWESPARPWFVVVPRAGDPVAVIPSIGAELMGQTWIADIRTWDAPDPNDDGVSLLADALGDLVGEQGRIGVPMGLETHLRMPLKDYEKLQRRLAPRRFVDATDPVQRVREIKSDAEVAKIREICAIAGRAFDRVPEFARRGHAFDQIVRDFQIALHEEGADWVSYVAGGCGADGYGSVISPPGPTPLRQGDVFMLDTGAVKDGYFCDFDRNYAAGEPSPLVERAHAALWQATDDVIAKLRPGLVASDVHTLMCDALRHAGAIPTGWRFGHGLGVTLTEWPSFSPVDSTPLRAGMVLTLEPGCTTQGDLCLVHEEVIVLRDDGAELLSPRAAQTLPVIPA